MVNHTGSVMRADSRPEFATLDLRSSRQKKGITLEEIAEGTKISIRFLRAIEAEEYEKLPGGIFTTSYLRQYAVAIGLEEGLLLGYYRSKAHATLETHELRRPEPELKPLLLRFWSAAAGR